MGRAFYSIREFFISQYDGELSFVDAELGVLFRRIKELGLDSKTMIIITADHGEHFGDNENADKDFIFEHGNSLFDIELKVPLIIKSNSDFIAKKKVLKEQVELIDVYPTILDYLEIKNTNSIEGISLLPGILGKEFQVKKYAFSELFRLAEEEGDTGQYFISVRTTRWKLISLEDLCNRSFCNNSNPKYYFFDIKNDPKEFNNLSGSRNQNFDVLKNELLEFINKSGSRKKPKSSYISNEEKQTLKNLGYLQ